MLGKQSIRDERSEFGKGSMGRNEFSVPMTLY